ncbi:hypothetical protein QKW60_15730 [Defluviimonas aestuarii]|uniref:hypothetical protein n=1 Tax=Albidovulum aestuarii TaxID=1130726 RepID=UPI00249A56C4|nr:hypothetical protein [Defluviimonas aestuarii]MDI3337861.1 hypothetical protein [Defluviimonas aestuarii]
MDKAMALLAFLVVAAFLGILAWYVAEIDLALVISLTVVLLGYDFLTSARDGRNGD